MGRTDVETLLARDGGKGVYILRTAPGQHGQPASYSFSVYTGRAPKHWRLEVAAGGLKLGEHVFREAAELVAHFRVHPIVSTPETGDVLLTRQLFY
jgi:hypothetical protein